MNTKHLSILLSGALTHLGALAHEGHGLPGLSHWHTTDVLGFAVAIALAVGAWIYIGRK